jgi:hypothetical protein
VLLNKVIQPANNATLQTTVLMTSSRRDLAPIREATNRRHYCENAGYEPERGGSRTATVSMSAP